MLKILQARLQQYAKAETPVLWLPHVKSWLIGKDSDAGRDWGQEEKGTTEDEMAGWHHRLDGSESEWTPGVGDGQGGLECWNSWGRKESETTEWLNWTELLECIIHNIVIKSTNSHHRCRRRTTIMIHEFFTPICAVNLFHGNDGFFSSLSIYSQGKSIKVSKKCLMTRKAAN